MADIERAEAEAPVRAESRLARVHQLQDRVLEKAMTIVDGTMAYSEIRGDEEEPPPEWVEQYGQKAAEERLRLAKYGLMSAKDAPVASKVATTVMAGIMKIQAAREGSGPRVINAVVVNMPSSSATMPEMIVTDGEET